MNSLKIKVVNCDDFTLEFKNELNVEVRYEVPMYVAENEELNILCYGFTIHELYIEVHKRIDELWRQFVVTDNISCGGDILRDKLKSMIKVVGN